MATLVSTTPSRHVKSVIGKVFTRLTVIAFDGIYEFPSGGRDTHWICRCSCGNKTNVSRKKLTCNKIKSCGCLNDELRLQRNTTHGFAKTKPKVYRIWQGIKTRCTNPKRPEWMNYGGRGITFCKRWKSFSNFLADMGEPPADKPTIERINNDGPYSPDNCRWADWFEQARNRRPRSR